MYLHTLDQVASKNRDIGDIDWQGQIIGTDGDDVIVQLFSWLFGQPTGAALIPRADLYDRKKIRLYAEHEEWKAAGDEFCAQKDACNRVKAAA
jgi:hypothetical protein